MSDTTPPSASAPGSARRVLVVDDDPDCSSTMAELLAMTGCEVRIAADGQTALRVVSAFRPEVILLDLQMPGMDGFAVAASVRADPANDRTLIIAITGRGMPADRLHSAAAGVDIHLVKPVPFDKIIEILSKSEQVPVGFVSASARPVKGRSKHTILVVDDTAAHRYAIARGLSGLGFHVLEASTGAEGMMKALGASAVVLDLVLPDLDGREVARRLRAAGAHMPIVLHSSLPVTDSDKLECKLAGGDAFVSSPAPPRLLARVLDMAMQQHAS